MRTCHANKTSTAGLRFSHYRITSSTTLQCCTKDDWWTDFAISL